MKNYKFNYYKSSFLHENRKKLYLCNLNVYQSNYIIIIIL